MTSQQREASERVEMARRVRGSKTASDKRMGKPRHAAGSCAFVGEE
jgi:hypothetical protein